jgi:hypothetical protein
LEGFCCRFRCQIDDRLSGITQNRRLHEIGGAQDGYFGVAAAHPSPRNEVVGRRAESAGIKT